MPLLSQSRYTLINNKMQHDTTDIQEYFARFAAETAAAWRSQDGESYKFADEDYTYLFLGLIVLYILAVWIFERRRTAK